MSAPRPGALASIFSLEPGTERQERRGRLRERSDMVESAKGAEPVSLQPCKSRRVDVDARRSRASILALAGASAGPSVACPARSTTCATATVVALIAQTRAAAISTVDARRDAPCAATSSTRLSGTGGRTDRARRRRRLQPHRNDCRASRYRRRRSRSVPGLLALVDVQRGIGSAEPIPLGPRHGRQRRRRPDRLLRARARSVRTPTRREHCSVACCAIAGAADDFEVPTDDVVHFDLSPCERAVGRRRGSSRVSSTGRARRRGDAAFDLVTPRALHLRAGRARRAAHGCRRPHRRPRPPALCRAHGAASGQLVVLRTRGRLRRSGGALDLGTALLDAVGAG